MAYATGVPVSETDLLQTLVAFLAAQGWTTNLSVADGVNGGWRAHMSKGGVFVNLRAMYNECAWPAFAGGNMNGIGLNVGTGFNGSNPWYDQAGVPQYIGSGPYPGGVQLSTNNNTAPNYSFRPFSRYHFFTDPLDNVVVVLEKAANVFGFMGWGATLIKSGGVWTGGLYCFADTEVGSAGVAQLATAAYSWLQWRALQWRPQHLCARGRGQLRRKVPRELRDQRSVLGQVMRDWCSFGFRNSAAGYTEHVESVPTAHVSAEFSGGARAGERLRASRRRRLLAAGRDPERFHLQRGRRGFQLRLRLHHRR